MSKTAYAILVVNSDTNVVRGIGIFSEPCPTLQIPCLLFTLHKVTDESYEKAFDECEKWCLNDYSARKLYVPRRDT